MVMHNYDGSNNDAPPGVLLLFDADGTIFDSQNIIQEGFRHAFMRNGFHPPPEEAVRHSIGLSLERAVPQIAPAIDPHKIGPIIHAYVEATRGADLSRALPFAGMRDLIHELSQMKGVCLGVATGKSLEGLEAMLAAHDLGEVFTIKQTGDRFASKPDPEMINHALAQSGHDPRRAVIIGDTSFDIEMGRAAGILSIGVSWGYHGARLVESCPDFLAKNPSEIIDILKNWDLI